MIQVVRTINQHFFVSNRSRNFGGEKETGRSFRVPTFHGRERRRAVKRRIEFDHIKFRCIKTEELLRFHSSRVERAFPTVGGERRRTHANLGLFWHDRRRLSHRRVLRQEPVKRRPKRTVRYCRRDDWSMPTVPSRGRPSIRSYLSSFLHSLAQANIRHGIPTKS